MKILHLTLHKVWFDQIASGIKTEEFRGVKPYWIKRLEGKVFDEIHFRNGYSKNAPFMRVEWMGCKRRFVKDAPNSVVSTEQYIIKLGKVLERR